MTAALSYKDIPKSPVLPSPALVADASRYTENDTQKGCILILSHSASVD